MKDLGESLRARGMRLTRQRERIIDAVRALGHATPDGLAAAVAQDGGPALSLSTIYRNLEALEEVGVVSHTHLDHRSPTYHLSDHADHLHLVCLSCGAVIESPVTTADPFVGNLLSAHGFMADVKHMAIHGWCAACSARTTPVNDVTEVEPTLSRDSGPAGVRPSPFLSRSGAVAGEGIDAAVAAHYGDPLREQRLLVEGLAAVDLSHRGVVTIAGPDRLSWLNSITTQLLTGLAPRTSMETLVLSPKGHIEHDLHLVDDGETTWATVEPGTASALVSWLDSMRFMLRVEVRDVSADYAVIGEPVRSETTAAEPLAWSDPWPLLVGDTAAYSAVIDPAKHPGSERSWRELIVPRDQLAALLGDRPLAGMWAAEALRVAAWRPRLGFETDQRTIAHEVDWLRTAVHLHKGCYRGQETVARVHNLGRPPRRLVFLHLDGSGHTLPGRGIEVEADGRIVGRLTSVARHHELGPIALAVIKRNTPLDTVCTAAGLSASQEEIVQR